MDKFNPAVGSLKTRDQMSAVIFLSCVEQTNAENHPDVESYDRALRARFRWRTGQQSELSA